MAGERSQTAASSTPGKVLKASEMLPRDLPGSDKRCLHERDLQDLAIEILQRLGCPAPGVPLHRQPPRRLADARRQSGIGEQAIYRVREGLRLVLYEEIAPWGRLRSPRRPDVVETMAFPMAMPSTILRRVPPPNRSGTTKAAAAARCGRRSGTKPVSSTRGPASA